MQLCRVTLSVSDRQRVQPESLGARHRGGGERIEPAAQEDYAVHLRFVILDSRFVGDLRFAICELSMIRTNW
jgi:hypothetical protein